MTTLPIHLAVNDHIGYTRHSGKRLGLVRKENLSARLVESTFVFVMSVPYDQDSTTQISGWNIQRYSDLKIFSHHSTSQWKA